MTPLLAGLMLISLLGWGLWPVADKMALRYTMHPIFMGIVYSITSLAFDLMAWGVGSQLGGVTVVFNRGMWWLVGGSLVSCTAMLTYSYAMQRADANIVTSITAAYPLVTLLASVLFLGEVVTPLRVVGAILTVIGAILVSL
jgi:transporter family protein